MSGRYEGTHLWPESNRLTQVQAFEIAKYGEMTTTHLGSKLWVVLNSDRLVNELYAKKGNITNERPPYPIANTLLSRGRRSIVLPVDGWTERRKLMQQLLSGTALVQYQKYQNSESLVLLRRYLEQPSLWYKHNSAYATSVIYRITFGESPDLKDVQEVQRAQKLFLLNVPPFNRWDCFPELATLPRFLQWWRAKYEALGEFTLRAYGGYWNSMRTKIEQGLAAPSFAADVIHGKFQGSDEDRMFLAMQLVGAGSDTTRLSINISILAAVVHPQAFYKARAEIDRVCGAGERLPNFDDEPSLPYVSAFIKELLRWRRIFNWTPEHALSEDLEFEGYHFPKGTCFVINHVVITNTYDEPEKILPERWLDGYERDLLRNNWQFGAGRRVCVGARLAQKSLFINVSRLICCFDFEAVSRLLPSPPPGRLSIDHISIARSV